LPENNGLILPSRVIRHFKQILPKKPKKSKTKKKKKKKNENENEKKEEMESSSNNAPIAQSALSDIAPNEQNDDDLQRRARTMIHLKIPKELNDLIEEQKNDNDHSFEIEPNNKNKRNSIEAVIERNKFDEQTFDENTSSKSKKGHMAKAKSIDITTQKVDISDTAITPDIVTPDIHIDHAIDNIISHEITPDVEQQPIIAIRAETDIKNMHHDLVEFKVEMLEEEKKEKEILNEKKIKTKKKTKKATNIIC